MYGGLSAVDPHPRQWIIVSTQCPRMLACHHTVAGVGNHPSLYVGITQHLHISNDGILLLGQKVW